MERWCEVVLRTGDGRTDRVNDELAKVLELNNGSKSTISIMSIFLGKRVGKVSKDGGYDNTYYGGSSSPSELHLLVLSVAEK